MPNLDPKVRALHLNVEGLLKLLGGSTSDRLRFWEILKGITTPAEFRLVSHQLDTMTQSVKQVQNSIREVKAAAKTARG